jgi:uncharacterized protein
MSSNSTGSPGTSPQLHATSLSLHGSGNSSRIFSIDVLRGIAILGILVISVWEFGGFTGNQQTFFRTGTHGGNYKLLSAVSILFEGKMRALFALLFGAAIILFVAKKDQPSTAPVSDLYIRRMLWLMLFGILNAVVLLWPGDILFQYSVLGILLFPFWRMSAKGLFIGALVVTLIYCGKQYWNYADDKKTHEKFLVVSTVEKKFASSDTVTKQKIDSLLRIQHNNPFFSPIYSDSLIKRHSNDTLTKEQAKDKQAWDGLVKGLKFDSSADKKLFQNMRSTSYGKIWNYVLPITQNRESYGLYRTGLWDIASMMLLGMALLVWGFFHRFSVKKYLLIALPALIIGLLLAWFRNHYQDLKLADYGKYIENNPVPFNQFFPVERALLAVGYASIVLALLRMNFLTWLWRVLAATGRMAFTNYFLQTILCTGFFYGYGMGYFGRMSQPKLYFFVAEVSLIQIVFSVLWLRYFTMGPVEWLWRYLIYKKKLPFKKQPIEVKVTMHQPTTVSN